jgi:transposase InsO family protein
VSHLQVSRSGFYAWRDRGPSPRTVENRALLEEIRRIHLETNEAYGAVKTWRALRSRGFACGRHRVAKLRHDAQIEARRKRRFRITTQSRQGQLVPALRDRYVHEIDEDPWNSSEHVRQRQLL